MRADIFIQTRKHASDVCEEIWHFLPPPRTTMPDMIGAES
jgi:hypothetical protein